MEFKEVQQVAGLANVALTKEQVIENLTVKAAKKYKSYVAGYVEKYTADDSKVKKPLEQLYNMDEKTLNTALRNFINGDTVKDADDVIRRAKFSNLTYQDFKKLISWAIEEKDKRRGERLAEIERQKAALDNEEAELRGE